jgi:hypothetical protein
VSGTGWLTAEDGKPSPRYHIKYAESADGVHWTRDGRVCIDYASREEHAFGRPCVVRDGNGYIMWYSYRGSGHSYRIGCAESLDGLTWTRRDNEAGLDPSADGWDSEMMAYPVVLRHRERAVMLYNGNGYGRTGIGLAVSDR